MVFIDDKLYNPNENISPLSNYPKGIINEMCSETERKEREKQGLISIFECENNDARKTNSSLAVASYCRISVGLNENKLLSKLRTPKALQDSFQYLLSSIMDKWRFDNSISNLDIYEFISDRCRSIIQEIRIQNIYNKAIIQIVEQMTRYYILCGYRFYNNDKFEYEIHIQQLQNLLLTLRSLYLKVSPFSNCFNEFEFCVYDLLLNYKHYDKLLQIFLFKKGKTYKKLFLGSKVFKESHDIYSSFISRNYIQFHNIYNNINGYIMHCLVFIVFLDKIREESLFILNYSSKYMKYPISCLQSLLGFHNNIQVIEYCKLYNIKIIDKDYVKFSGKPLKQQNKHYSSIHDDNNKYEPKIDKLACITSNYN